MKLKGKKLGRSGYFLLSLFCSVVACESWRRRKEMAIKEIF
jgi:hypothetical protein